MFCSIGDYITLNTVDRLFHNIVDSLLIGEKELVEFLTEEILAEKKVQKSATIPSELDGFKVKLDRAEVELSKQNAGEKILVKFNVNHTVDAEESPEIEEDAEGKAELGEMKSKPTFEVDIVRGESTLSFTCSFLQGQPAEGEYGERGIGDLLGEFV